jgi:hypothetical protein
VVPRGVHVSIWVSFPLASPPTLGPPPSPAADPAAAFLHTLLRDMGQDGATAPPETLTSEYAAVCAAGVKAACSPASWHGPDGAFDLAALGRVMTPRCGPSDPTACLLLGWVASQRDPGAFVRDLEPEVARARFTEACAAGLERGCSEVGQLLRYGIGTYGSSLRASVIWRSACAAGEPEACRALANLGPRDARALLERAVRAGHAPALADLADRDDTPADERHALHVAACEAGGGRSCRALALEADPADAVRWTAAGCALRDAESCARVSVARVAAEPAARDAAIAELRARCPASDYACDEAAFLAAGASPRLDYPGALGPKDIDRTLTDLKAPSHRCLLAALVEDPDIAGPVEVRWRVETDGAVGGVRVGTTNAALRACLATVWSGAKFRPPAGGPVFVVRDLPLGHEAAIDVSSDLGSEVGGDLHRIGDGLRRQAQAFDDCFVRDDDPTRSASLTVEVRALRDGRLLEPTVVDGELRAGAERCVLELVGATVLPTPPEIPVRARIRFDFAQPASAAPAPTTDPPPAWSADEPFTLRVLVVSAPRAVVEGHKAHLTDEALASITAAHADLADWVAEHSRGALRLQQRFVEWPTPLDAGGYREQGGVRRWNLDPSELPEDLYLQVEDGDYDSVFVWLPIPAGYPRPALGVTFAPTHRAQRAVFSSGAIAHHDVLRANAPAPPFELPLHELYHQLEFQTALRLGVELPSNHDQVRYGGRTYSPRTWAAPNPRVLDWYDLMLGRALHPDLWRDAYDPDLGRSPGSDLAVGAAIVDADALSHGGRLVDGAVFAPAAEAPRARPTFSIAWEAPRTIHRVVAHVSAVPGGPPDGRAVTVSGRVGGEWRDLGRAEVVVDPTVEVRFEALAVDAVRLTIEEPAADTVSCRELEVFGPDVPR